MKQNYYKISDTNKFSTVIQFLRKECGLTNSSCPVVSRAFMKDSTLNARAVLLHQLRLRTLARRYHRQPLQMLRHRRTRYCELQVGSSRGIYKTHTQKHIRSLGISLKLKLI